MHPTFVSSARRSSGLCSLALLLALSACGGEGTDGTTREASPAGAGEQTAVPPAGASSNRLELTISAGPFAGTHQVTDDVTCVADPSGWVVASNRPGSQGVSQTLLVLEGVPLTGGSSPEVSFTAHFGDAMDDSSPNSGSVSVDPAGGEGAGTGTVRRDGRGAVIEVDGTTSDGARVSAVTRCGTVAGIQ
jgi:hypothetical protein